MLSGRYLSDLQGRGIRFFFGLLKSEQLRYLDFYTLIKLTVILPHGVCKIPRKF
jgi:hypothetical protein